MDNSNKLRSQAAIALVSAWCYLLLANLKVVKRTKATSLLMADDVISYLDKLASERKLNMSVNVKQPILEQSNQILEDDGNDYSNDEYELQTHDMITPYNYPTDDEFVHHEIANNFDSYDGNSDVAYESEFKQ